MSSPAEADTSRASPAVKPELGGSAPVETVDPYIPASTEIAELTPRALILGTVLGMIFGASSLYLVLKVGLTVSASIPVAVISITLFRLMSKLGFKDATVLENNIAQTAGSAGESIAFGIGVTMPAIMILGFTLDLTLVALVAVLGGLLGILMMIPLRRALIVQQHGILKYPEGTACAAVLKAGASAESRAASSAAAKAEVGAHVGMSGKTIFVGFAVGLLYKTAMNAIKLWKDTPEKLLGAPLSGGSVASEISPELLGVGYIIGPRIAAVMCGGGVLAYLVLIPMIKFFGSPFPGVLPPGEIPIALMKPHDIRSAYVLYIGAGAVAAGGIISLVRAMPTIWSGLREGLKDFRSTGKDVSGPKPRTEQDLPMKTVLLGSLGLIAAISLAPSLHMNVLGAILIVVFGFLFVTVSSRLTGEIGSSSNPISGMTVATLLLTCVIFLIVGWKGGPPYVTALSVGAIVCIAASNGGTTSQDLKTGHLLGATPKKQQISILVGALASSLVLGPILLKMNDAATVYDPVSADAAAELHVDPATLTESEKLSGPQAAGDPATYKVWHRPDPKGGAASLYLVDAATGQAKYLKDPGINGTVTKRPDGSEVKKYDAPKATLMSYIIKGILDGKLPWSLVLFGVMIAVVLELSGIPSLAFAVGVYLPLSSSVPILIGGGVRWVVDRVAAKRHVGPARTEAEEAAESDKSPGVLMSSGYIAGGAIAGIIIAFMQGVTTDVDHRIEVWMKGNNPFFEGPWSDLLSMLPFVVITVLLLLVGIEKLLATPAPKEGAAAR